MQCHETFKTATHYTMWHYHVALELTKIGTKKGLRGCSLAVLLCGSRLIL